MDHFRHSNLRKARPDPCTFCLSQCTSEVLPLSARSCRSVVAITIRHAALAPTSFTLDNELRVFASRSRCKNSVGLNAVGAEGSATAHGNFSRERALEATTENRWKVLGFALVAIARLEIAGAAPMDFVSRRQSGSLAAPGQTDARHGRGMHGLGGRIGRQSCTSWSLGPLRGELADGH